MSWGRLFCELLFCGCRCWGCCCWDCWWLPDPLIDGGIRMPWLPAACIFINSSNRCWSVRSLRAKNSLRYADPRLFIFTPMLLSAPKLILAKLGVPGGADELADPEDDGCCCCCSICCRCWDNACAVPAFIIPCSMFDMPNIPIFCGTFHSVLYEMRAEWNVATTYLRQLLARFPSVGSFASTAESWCYQHLA